MLRRWLLHRSYIIRATSMINSLRRGENVSPRKFNALLKALEDANLHETTEFFVAMWDANKTGGK